MDNSFEKKSVKQLFKLWLEDFKSYKTSKKLFVYALFAFVIIDIFCCVFVILNRHNTPVKLECVGFETLSNLKAIDSCAHKGIVSNANSANFKFQDSEKLMFDAVYEEYGSVALTVRIKLLSDNGEKKKFADVKDLPVKYGFLTSQDFNSKDKFIKNIYPVNRSFIVQGNLKNAPEVFDLCISVQRGTDLSDIKGFFVYSTKKIRIMGACIVPAVVGFDVSTEIPFYGFAYNGGNVNFDNSSFDFSGASSVFALTNSGKKLISEYEISFSKDEDKKSTLSNSVRSEFSFGGEKLSCKNVTGTDKILIPSSALKYPYSRMDISSNKDCITAVLLKTEKSDFEKYTAIKTDPGLILKYPMEEWRDEKFEVFNWDRFPQILFFDTKDYDVQAKFFTRLAYYVEKQGFKGTLLTNEELEGKHGYNAHDYSSESMASFFNYAAQTNFKLNDEEYLLKQILIDNGLFEQDGNFVRSKEGGIVSISQETKGGTRTSLLAHEGWHTLFFTDAEFRNYVSAVYYTMDPSSLDFIIDYFKSQPTLGYDTNDDYLMHNEFMAYILQQPLNSVSKYFVSRAEMGSVMRFTPDLCKYIKSTNARGIEDAAIALNDYIFTKYGIICGNIALVSR